MSANCSICGGSQPAARSKAEKRALLVSIVTLLTMAAEITFGIRSGSMALLADGIHMGTHVLALGITVLAYFLARTLRTHPGFSFGTGKVGVLGGYTNALLLGVTAIIMVYESIRRLLQPEHIRFDEAILVAAVGLVVNLASAAILKAPSRTPGEEPSRARRPEHGDSNLKAALVHVLSDALTSVLAIAALGAGKGLGWSFLDPAVALLGAALILRWAWGLLRNTGKLLLDFGDYREEVRRIKERLEAEGGAVCDIHIWRYSENERSLILTVQDPRGRSSQEIRSALGELAQFAHVTVEVCEK
jgi:cation diffusion facilitator family transporter